MKENKKYSRKRAHSKKEDAQADSAKENQDKVLEKSENNKESGTEKSEKSKKNFNINDIFKSPLTYIAMVVLAALIAFSTFYSMEIASADGIAKGISVDGIDLGTMTKAEAEIALKHPADLTYKEITMTAKGKSTTFLGGDILLGADIKATVEKAYIQGRNGNCFQNIKRKTMLYFHPENYKYTYCLSTDMLKKLVYDFGISVNGEMRNYTTEYAADYVDISEGIAGQSKNVDAAVVQVKEAIAEEKYSRIAVTLEENKPVEPTVDSLYDEIYLEPQDAKYEIKDGEFLMVPEVIGRQIDKIEAGTQIEKLRNGEKIRLKLVTLVPKVTLAALNQKLFNYTLAQYSTTYSTSNKNRSSNLTLAASKINGTILIPDGVFSYNEVVGDRTAASGFKEAGIFENGETVQGMGGGVCQISSTLYSAVLYADLKVVQRQSHSMTVGYVPKGQDATVAYGSIDFKFSNDTAYPIKIVANASGGKVTVSILGTKPETERTVKITNNILSTIAPTVQETQSQDLLTGKRQVETKGKTGYTVETIRTVFENGKETKTEKVGKSVYKMIPTKVLVGAKVPAGLAPLPPLETQTPATPEPAPLAESTPIPLDTPE